MTTADESSLTNRPATLIEQRRNLYTNIIAQCWHPGCEAPTRFDPNRVETIIVHDDEAEWVRQRDYASECRIFALCDALQALKPSALRHASWDVLFTLLASELTLYKQVLVEEERSLKFPLVVEAAKIPVSFADDIVRLELAALEEC